MFIYKSISYNVNILGTYTGAVCKKILKSKTYLIAIVVIADIGFVSFVEDKYLAKI